MPFPSYLLSNGSRNSAYGAGSLLANSSGDKNTAMGYASLGNNIGSENTGIGNEALAANEGGTKNTAVGSEALRQNTMGNWNVAIGSIALQKSTSGVDNVAVGADALKSALTASNNVAVGSLALGNNESGSGNTAVGTSAGGVRNHLIGCTFIGNQAYPSVGSLTNATAIGNNARPTKSNQMVFGDGSVKEIGGAVNWSIISDGSFKKNIQEDVSGLDFIMLLSRDEAMTSLPKQPAEVTGHPHHAAQLRATLEQNAPNPFKEQTVIRYYLPEETSNAQIVITDMNGTQLRTIELFDRGTGQVMLQGQSLMQGQYIYSLVVNGRLADSKRMVIF